MGADFAFIEINQHLGDNLADIPNFPGFTFKGNESETFFFEIAGDSGKRMEGGYLLIQTYDVSANQHKILINGRNLPADDIARHPADKVFQTWMDFIPAGYLLRGQTNSIKIVRETGGDNFLIRGVAIHWKE